MKEAIAKGIAYLNENEPGWLSAIDLETLDMHDPYKDIIAQITGRNYRHYFEQHFVSDDEAVELGFYLHGKKAHTSWSMPQEEIDRRWQQAEKEEAEEHAALTAEWKKAIATLRASAHV